MAQQILDLTGNWQFKEYPTTARRMRDLDEGNWLDCTIPNSIFTNLIEAGTIDRFAIDANPENYTWVSDRPWVFRRGIDLSQELLTADRIELVCDGLDTIASIWLNEKLLGRTDNMFIQHRFDVTKYIKPAGNSLLVKFDPVVPYAKGLMERYTPFSDVVFLNPYRAYVRKAQYQFGWDFCPSLPGCGIWRPVRLESMVKARLANVHVRTIHCDKRGADIRIAVTLDRVMREKYNCALAVHDSDGNIVTQLKFEPHGDSGSAVFHIDNPQLWFPAGYGRAHLYQARVNLLAGDQIIDTAQSTFGIRTAKLNQAKDKYGRRFEFEITGQRVYAKGADWVPASVLAGSVGRDEYDRLINAAAEANMNMLRVWGGGYYEEDYFYELCDRLGIMVWQDFMFACCYYPDRQWFLEKVETEARCVIERLWNHPSVILFCGNNEVDWMHYQHTHGSGKRLYGKNIWHGIVPRTVNELDPDRIYIPTTPFSITDDPNEPGTGVTHNWDVWSANKPVSDYLTEPERIGRFVAEFGFQSVPCLDTVREFCRAEQLHPAAAALEKHNYQVDGVGRLHRYLADVFGSGCNLEQLIYLSQLVQARGVKAYVEFLRANRDINSGALFWQLNDCCGAISWSAIDYRAQAKALYYYARRFFAPILLTAMPQFDRRRAGHAPKVTSLSAVVVNDTGKPVTGNMLATLVALDGQRLDEVDLPAAVGPYSASHPIRLPRAVAEPANPERCVLRLQLQSYDTTLAENLHFYLPDKYIDWPQPTITNQLSQTDAKTGLLTLSSDTFARDVVVHLPGAVKLSDNYVDLLPHKSIQIHVQFDSAIKDTASAVQTNCVASALGR
jgi:beta-mannosidase